MTGRRRTTRLLAAALAAAPLALAPAPALAAPAETVQARCAPGLPVQHPGCGRTYPGADAGNGTVELRGADRYATAVAVARHGFPEADAVVLASGEDAHLVDALSAGPLARRLAAPLLLTARGALPAATAEHLRALAPAAVLVVGGEGAVAEAVMAQVRALGVASVGRVGGGDRYATSRAVAALQPGATRAWVASGEDAHLVDALAAAGAAARLGEPLVLAPATGDASATAGALRAAGVTATTVVGGTSSVGAAVAAQFPAPARVEGPDRWRTALAVAGEAVRRGLPRTDLLVTSGEQRRLVDALAAGPLGRATLLTGARGTGEDLVREWERAGSDRTAFVGAAAARLVCWDAAGCASVAAVDVDGDGALDDVGVAGSGSARQVRVRVDGDVVT
ncbi:cell wall-binding repeat-containing protein, partial [Kineococcus indalonis]|uniref:cell wall-binding repeat-containing protein n=1 Tax=Kineococcus indalonis TaxID=2696566 RepID=UPI001411CB89